ncbi:curli production assembly/transport protein CsgE [Vibrio chagasii]|uniref:curli production assembly/transport protein CsgE n=1 Tax=Vibrio chagasii TaxID=170679 RepID=UPI003DA01350
MKYKLLTITLVSCIVSAGDTSHGLENGAPLGNGTKLEDSTNNLKEQFNDFSEVNGIIVDRTITRLGDDFYFFFSQSLNESYPDLKENLTVKERPTALSGSIIEVQHSRKPIFRTALSPGRRQAKERAADATRVVGNYIIRWQAERLFQDTYDLDHDEF